MRELNEIILALLSLALEFYTCVSLEEGKILEGDLQLFPGVKPWSAGRELCFKNGRDYASVQNMDENNRITNFAKTVGCKFVTIGLAKTHRSAKWVALDGETTFRNWKKGEPMETFDKFIVGRIESGSGLWLSRDFFQEPRPSGDSCVVCGPPLNSREGEYARLEVANCQENNTVSFRPSTVQQCLSKCSDLMEQCEVAAYLEQGYSCELKETCDSLVFPAAAQKYSLYIKLKRGSSIVPVVAAVLGCLCLALGIVLTIKCANRKKEKTSSPHTVSGTAPGAVPGKVPGTVPSKVPSAVSD